MGRLCSVPIEPQTWNFDETMGIFFLVQLVKDTIIFVTYLLTTVILAQWPHTLWDNKNVVNSSGVQKRLVRIF